MGGRAGAPVASRVVPEPVDAAATLKELRSARRRHRLEDLDWLDAAYHAYLAGIVGGAIVLFASSFVGGERVSAATVTDVVDRGPAILGVLAALAVPAGLRSGSRGGPLAIEPAEARYVLQAPIERGLALRAAAWRQLRFAVFAGAVVGAIAGQLAVRRLGGAPVAWVASGALFGATVAVLGIGAALVASGYRLPRWAATLLGTALLVWSVLDATEVVPGPFRFAGGIALWPLELNVVDVVATAIAIALAVLGLVALGGVSLESAERRTGLVSQLRFAVTLQDLRTVVLLRRQLALDLPRVRPWLRSRRGRRPRSVWARDWRGLARFPLSRLIRLVLCGVVAGAAARGVWEGIQPLIVVAGVALFIAGLDAVEPLAQEVDQDDRLDSWPVEHGVVLVRHLPVAAIVMVLVTALGAAVAIALSRTSMSWEMAAVCLLPAALGAGSGAAVSVVTGVPQPAKDGQILPPEVAGMKIAFRTAFPVILSVLGVLPVLIGYRVYDSGDAPIAAAATVAAFLSIPVALTVAWVRFREPAHEWWQTFIAEGQQATDERRRARSGSPA